MCVRIRIVVMVLTCVGVLSSSAARAQVVMENLGRGVVVVRQAEASAYVGWRLLGTDPAAIGFNLYRAAGSGRPVRLNKTSLTKTTDFVDTTLDPSVGNSYTVRAVVGGKELAASAPFVLPANAPIRQFLAVPLQPPAGGRAPGPSGAPTPYMYSANDASVVDLDGDGEYEIVLKWDPSPRDRLAERGL